MRNLVLLPVALITAAMVLARPAGAAGSLFTALGGKPGVEKISSEAITLYMTDPRLHAYFDNINPTWLQPHFVLFICHVADGPCAYHGRSMAAAHRGLAIDEAAFDAVVEDLQTALRRQHIPYWTQNRLLARLAPMEREIVTR